MGFTRYFQDAQTPEWEKAYINYRALKSQLMAIRSKGPQQVYGLRPLAGGDTNSVRRFKPDDEEKCNDIVEEVYLNRRVRISVMRWRISNKPTSAPRRRRFLPASPIYNPESLTLSPLQMILSNLPPIHAKFFNTLDAELNKVELFYAAREEEMSERVKTLRRQLDELGKHRRLFYESIASSKCQSRASKFFSLSKLRWFSGRNMKHTELDRTGMNGISVVKPGHEVNRDFSNLGGHTDSLRKNYGTKEAKHSDVTSSGKSVDDRARLFPKHSHGHSNLSSRIVGYPLDPGEYGHAKSRLRKAVVEHYRGLELLNTYRDLNLTCIRKLLKKYGKITKVPVLDAYMEKIETSSFASGAKVSIMLKEMEHLFAMRFEHGNKRRTVNHLRFVPIPRTYHSSTFRSGIWLGLAFAAITEACYLSFQEQTRAALPSWDILLFIYSIFIIPVLLALLIGINIFVWARSRINYTFILKLDPRSRLDYREYFELPAFLLCALAFAFWLSLTQIGPPTLWPLIWLAFSFVIMLNPVHSFMRSQARWWTVKNIIKLGISGVRTVEFADLWLGDQFCSLVYSLSNLYFVGCFYTNTFINASAPHSSTYAYHTTLQLAYNPQVREAWAICGASQNWGWYFLLGVLPFLARFFQCLRRYWDSKLYSQLINAGKYLAGIMQYLLYFYWRHQMSPHTGRSYALFCFAATINSIYGCGWDYFVDWSMCKPYARYPLLRPDLVHESKVSLYYLAMLSDLCMRFIWLILVFLNKGNVELQAFIAAMVEVLRRVQWNFYRLENKHLSNTDLYRVTRELPLPYNLDVKSGEEEGQAAQLRSRKRVVRLS